MTRTPYTLRVLLGLSSTQPPDWDALSPVYTPIPISTSSPSSPPSSSSSPPVYNTSAHPSHGILRVGPPTAADPVRVLVSTTQLRVMESVESPVLRSMSPSPDASEVDILAATSMDEASDASISAALANPTQPAPPTHPITPPPSHPISPSTPPQRPQPPTYQTQDPTRTASYLRPYDSKGRPTSKEIRNIDRKRCEAMNFVMRFGVEWVGRGGDGTGG